MVKFSFYTLALIGGLLSQNVGAQEIVVPDGQTDTQVYDNADGSIRVDIAPPEENGISHNTFERFNVPGAGLDFDNRVDNARTIIGEVTGGSRSLIEGPIEVMGQRAHVILANPNGITVDGGRFINTGGVVLATSAIGFVERVPAPFRTQINTTVDITRGEIIIGPNGLSGAMDALHLLSKNLRIEGAIENENPSPFS